MILHFTNGPGLHVSSKLLRTEYASNFSKETFGPSIFFIRLHLFNGYRCGWFVHGNEALYWRSTKWTQINLWETRATHACMATGQQSLGDRFILTNHTIRQRIILWTIIGRNVQVLKIKYNAWLSLDVLRNYARVQRNFVVLQVDHWSKDDLKMRTVETGTNEQNSPHHLPHRHLGLDPHILGRWERASQPEDTDLFGVQPFQGYPPWMIQKQYPFEDFLFHAQFCCTHLGTFKRTRKIKFN